ncbi:MAG: cation transporter, partial [Mucilaginibacter polytrichastri]|nr:cation transporter [Mucilaginibacter polytrichastri]
WLDPLISLVIMVVILAGTWGLLKESLALSLDAVPEALDTDKIVSVIRNCDEVCEVSHVHIWAISTTQNGLTAHIAVRPHTSVEKIGQIKDEIRHALLHENINHATLEIDYNGAEKADPVQCEKIGES